MITKKYISVGEKIPNHSRKNIPHLISNGNTGTIDEEIFHEKPKR